MSTAMQSSLPVRVMAIVNLTADSFSDGGRLPDTDAAERHARALVEAGADILDLGAESTRPGASPVSPASELDRLLPLIERLADLPVPISVDTRHPETMRAVIKAGVAMINDVNALQAPGAMQTVADSSVSVCLMHMRGDPLTMQQRPVYRSVVSEVGAFLESRCDAARAAGIADDRLIVDPGIGFGKTMQHNLALLRSSDQLSARCRAPVLIGASRKSLLGEITGQPVNARLAGSIAVALAAVAHGAAIVRVHDARETIDALRVWQAVSNPADDEL